MTVYSPKETQYEKPISDLMERKAIAWAQLPADFREAKWESGRKALSFVFSKHQESFISSWYIPTHRF